MSKPELEELSNHLEETTYLTVDGIVDYVKKHYGILYTTSGMTQLLHRLGFTYKKSKLVPAKADKEKQEQFLNELAETRQNKGEEDPILYMDGVHPQHNTMPAYGWVKKGKDHFIKSNTGRKRVNINGVLDAETHKVITRDDDSINAQSTIKLLKEVEEKYMLAKDIYVICDNAKYYRSRLVKEFLETSKIQLLFLRNYSYPCSVILRESGGSRGHEKCHKFIVSTTALWIPAFAGITRVSRGYE